MNENAKLQLQRLQRRSAKPATTNTNATPRPEPADAILTMQRTVGNQAVQRQLRGAGLPASLIPAAGSVLGNHAIQRLIQTKLNVGPPGDSYEREADRVASQVMQAPAQDTGLSVQRAGAEEEELQTKPLAGTIARRVQRAGGESEGAGAEEEELQTRPLAGAVSPAIQRAAAEEEELQTKRLTGTISRRGQPASANEGFEASSSLEDRLASQKGGGSPLPNEVRSFMEPRFGTDFAGVKIHTGSDAAQMNREVQAQAFTLGHDIYLGEGKYNPGSTDGKRLLAHELTHVVQQTGAPAAQPRRDKETGS